MMESRDSKKWLNTFKWKGRGLNYSQKEDVDIFDRIMKLVELEKL